MTSFPTMPAVGFLDRMKHWLGAGEASEEPEEASAQDASGHSTEPSNKAGALSEQQKKLQALRRVREASGGRERPVRADIQPPSQSVEDALAEREAGRNASAREILAQIDRGGGLRTVLRAAAALEAKDARELEQLLPAVVKEAQGFRLYLQTASVLSNPERASALIERAKSKGAPVWAIAWSKVLSKDELKVREALVELLFADPALAKTVAARDLGLEGAVADPEALSRYTSFAHGRDCIRRFGAEQVADLIDKACASGAV